MPGEILLDARPLQTADAARGIGTYVRGLVHALAAAEPRPRLAVLVDAALPAPELPPSVGRHQVRRRYRGRLAGYEDAAVLGQDLDRIQPAVYHATTLRLPARSPSPVVVTLHDLIPWAWGGPWMVGERLRYYAGKRLLRRAEAIIAVSEATAADAHVHARVPRDRITVVAEAAEPEFRPADGAAERVAARWGLRGDYLFYAGALDRRKDPVGLVRAWRAARRAGLDAELVIAGTRAADAPGQLGGARLVGRVTAAELADLYRAAGCLLFASRYEGFGLPLLEAMACGCPVVAYDNSAIPELVGGVGRLAPDGNAVALGAAAAGLLSDPEERKRAVAAGLAKARAYSWAKAAVATLKVYRGVSGSMWR